MSEVFFHSVEPFPSSLNRQSRSSQDLCNVNLAAVKELLEGAAKELGMGVKGK